MRLLTAVWDVEKPRSAFLGGLAATVVTRRSLDLRMAGQLLDGAEIGAGVKEIADERLSR
jgi:hypothetical protein